MGVNFSKENITLGVLFFPGNYYSGSNFFRGVIIYGYTGSKTDDSCIYQLLPITQEIYKSIGDGIEVRIVFLDISKAFDKVWHNEVILKLEQNGISGDLVNILIDFIGNRKQRVA